MAGQSSTPEVPSPKLVYEDETGKVFLYYSEPESRLYLHADLPADPNLSTLKHWKKVLDEVEHGIVQRGINRLWTFAIDHKTFRFNKFVGFQSAYVVFNNYIELMYKDL